MWKASSLATACLLGATAAALAGPNLRTISGNEYGGKTEFVAYSEDDREYRDGVAEKITSYDEKGSVVRVEIHATTDLAENKGWDRSVTYYWGERKIGEVYSTDSDSAVSGFYQMVDYLEHDKLSKREFYIRPNSVIGTLGVYKRVIHYDANGNQTNFEDLDRLGNPVTISLEDYRKAQEKVRGSMTAQ
jgi:hypothetical protein